MHNHVLVLNDQISWHRNIDWPNWKTVCICFQKDSFFLIPLSERFDTADDGNAISDSCTVASDIKIDICCLVRILILLLTVVLRIWSLRIGNRHLNWNNVWLHHVRRHHSIHLLLSLVNLGLLLLKILHGLSKDYVLSIRLNRSLIILHLNFDF